MAVSLQILSSSLDTYEKINKCASNLFSFGKGVNSLKKKINRDTSMKAKELLKDEHVNYPVMKGIKCIV
jgi:hypothetical protein